MRIVRFLIVRLVQLFYPRIEVRGRAHLPGGGPLLFVSNHPNGLLDPLVLMVGLRRHIAFLAKSTFFANPVGRMLMHAFDALPVYRQRDEGQEGGAQGDRGSRNEATFALCRAVLQRGHPLALFPEGTTHSQTRMLPLRTGAARIALSAEAETSWAIDLQIVPVGLWYQNKALFRSAVLLVIGQPLRIDDLAPLYATDAHAAVDTLTDRVDAALDAVVLQAESAEVLKSIPLVAAWTAPREPQTLEEQHARTAELLAAYQRLHAADPGRLALIEHDVRRYARVLRTLGIDDPWDLELNAARRWRLLGLGLLLLAGFVPALAGFALSYGPYRLAAPLTPVLLGKYEETTSTGKLIIGSVLVCMGWLIAALICGGLFGAGWGLALLLLAAPLAYIALRWGELWYEFREALAYTWLTLRHATMVRELVARRHALAERVRQAVEQA
ncbi:MAG: lysophospholipid acyltransferase family protein [Kouleothrix sp.]|jgi:1-acyl-sn-glycerol-3-phosphate acyltransferase|nr:1-acyl-sn-glycerol-3-phosphate acyltransferase [Kouleothrix sp.]